MNESKWLLGELPTLQTAGVLDETSVEKLRRHYGAKMRDDYRYFVWMTSIAGVLMISSGAAIFAAFNWGALGKIPKLAVAAAPLLFGLALGLVAIVRKSQALSECAALVNALGTVVFYKIFLSLYHLEGNIDTLALPVLTAWVMLIYIFNSASLTLLYSLGLFALSPAGDAGLARQFSLAVAVVPFVLYHLSYRDKMRVAMRYAALALGIFGALRFADYYPPLYSFTLFVLLIFGGWEISERRTGHFANPWLLFPFGCFLFLLATATTRDSFYAIARPNAERGSADFETMRLIYWLATGGLLAVLAAIFPRRRWDAKRVLPVILILGMIYPLRHDANAIWMRIFVGGCAGLLGFVLVGNGIRRLSMLLFNGGWLILFVIIGCHLFNPAIHIYYRAGALVSGGVALILANAIFAWHIRKLEAKESVRSEKPDAQTEATK